MRRSMFQSLKSPVHGDAQRGQTGQNVILMSRTRFPLPLLLPLLPLRVLLSPLMQASTSPLISRLATSSTYSCTPWDAKLIC